MQDPRLRGALAIILAKVTLAVAVGRLISAVFMN